MNEISQLKAATIQLHELYTELQQAGFKRKEALYVIAVMLAHSAREGE